MQIELNGFILQMLQKAPSPPTPRPAIVSSAYLSEVPPRWGNAKGWCAFPPALMYPNFHSISRPLRLLTNAVMAWNTQHMQSALNTIEKLGNQPVLPEHLCSIAPTSLEGINLRGTFDFPIADHVHWLMPSLMVVGRHSLAAGRLRFRRCPPAVLKV